MMKKVWACLSTLVHLVLLPVYVSLFLLFLSLWLLLTATGVGPAVQYCFYLADKRKLDPERVIAAAPRPSEMRRVSVPAGLHSCSPDRAYNVFAVYMEPADEALREKYPPVCIPNGLGATATLISSMQEKLVQAGFRVLSFDRLGVGLSDANTAALSPTARDVVREMDHVMNAFRPADERWILLGPSMGSIVAQCYISAHPHKCVGLLNMDGLPYPFFRQARAFQWAAFIYRVYASLVWTGVLRPFIGIALRSNHSMFDCENFSLSVAIAQINQSEFFRNVAREMQTMMDCCEMAELAWGAQSVLRIPEEHLKVLVRAPPTVSIDFHDRTGERRPTSMRSASEVGDDWATPEEVQRTVTFLKSSLSSRAALVNAVSIDVHGSKEDEPIIQSNVVAEKNVSATADASAPLLKNDTLGSQYDRESSTLLSDVWGRLIVRVMSGRNHDFGNSIANSFYVQEMRDMAAAEHAKHTLLAFDGARTNYPRLTHTVLFSKTDDIVRNIQEIGTAYLKLQQQRQ